MGTSREEQVLLSRIVRTRVRARIAYNRISSIEPGSPRACGCGRYFLPPSSPVTARMGVRGRFIRTGRRPPRPRPLIRSPTVSLYRDLKRKYAIERGTRVRARGSSLEFPNARTTSVGGGGGASASAFPSFIQARYAKGVKFWSCFSFLSYSPYTRRVTIDGSPSSLRASTQRRRRAEGSGRFYSHVWGAREGREGQVSRGGC